MSALENDLGVTLFERTPRGIVLTTAGQLALIRATEVAASVTGLRRDLSTAFGLGGRNVRLAGFPSFVIGPLAAALGTLETGAADQPDAVTRHSYEVVEAEPPEALVLLDNGAIDVAFVFHHEDEDPPRLEGATTIDLGEDRLDLLVPERWNRAGQIHTLADVAELPWIMGATAADRPPNVSAGAPVSNRVPGTSPTIPVRSKHWCRTASAWPCSHRAPGVRPRSTGSPRSRSPKSARGASAPSSQPNSTRHRRSPTSSAPFAL